MILSIKSNKNKMVPEVGLEPTSLAAGDFESPASTSSATRALWIGVVVFARSCQQFLA